MENKTHERLEKILLDVNLTEGIIRRVQDSAKVSTDPKVIAYKLAGDVYFKLGNYDDALTSYELAGVKPDDEVVHNVQKSLMWESDLSKLRKNVVKYGVKYSPEDVQEKYGLMLGDRCEKIPSKRPNNKLSEKGRNSISKLMQETGVPFERKLIEEEYRKAFDKPYIHVARNIFENSDGIRFIPRTNDDLKLINTAYGKSASWNNLAFPDNIKQIKEITGIAPSYKLLYLAGKERAEYVARGSMHQDYLKEFVEATGMKHLGIYLFKMAGGPYPKELRKETNTGFKEHCKTERELQEKPGFLKRIFGGK